MVTSEQRKYVGQLFTVGFHGTSVNDEIKSLIQDYGVGSVILFKRNVASARQLRRLCRDLQTLARTAHHPRPLLLSTDQENGLVTRIGPPIAAQLPGAMALAATGSPSTARRVAAVTAATLRHFGIHVVYAPVADVNSEPRNPVIGVRSPADDPHTVARFVVECAAGLRAAGVGPCVKHFPGHGDTVVDSHVGLPVVGRSRAQLEEVELVPFRRAVEDGAEMVMTAHVVVPALAADDKEGERPASLSRAAMGFLRGDVGFGGVVVTDCLEMEAVGNTCGTVEGALAALAAGADGLMVCHTYGLQTAAIDRVCAALGTGEVSPLRVQEALGRLEALKAKFASWDRALRDDDDADDDADDAELGEINARAAEVARAAYADAVTVVRAEPGVLPVSATATVLFVWPGREAEAEAGGGLGEDKAAATQPTRVAWVSASLAGEMRSRGAATLCYTETEPLGAEAWRDVDDADVVVLATRDASSSAAAAYQRRLGLAVAERRRGSGRALVCVATGAPYDFLEDGAVANVIAVYEPTAEAFRAAVDVIYGVERARGKLPVKGGFHD